MGLSLVLNSRCLILKCSRLIGAWFVICASSPNVVVGTSLPTFRGTPRSLYTSWYFPGQVTSKTLCSFIVEALYIWGKKPVLLQLSLRHVGILLLSCSSFAFFVMLHFDRKKMNAYISFSFFLVALNYLFTAQRLLFLDIILTMW